MWLFTRYGFYSAVCARQGDGGFGQPVDETRIMVRARRREHLEALLDRFADLLGEAVIHKSDSSDYRFRIFLDKTVWAQVVERLAMDIDYDNFKSEVARHIGTVGAPYEHALHEVWSVMYRLQD